MSFLPTFLHSSLLWFACLAAVPLLLHLLTLHRLKTVELSTFRFLFDSYQQQRRRMQFIEALLAILRFLFILFLVFLFSRPVVKNWDRLFGGGAGGRDVVLLMDCSASMNARTAGTPAIDRAKQAAASVVERLRPDDRLTLIRVAAQPEEVFSRFTTDAKGIQDKIDGLKTSASRANMFKALMQLFGPDASRRTNPLVYLFTDCQSSGWREVKSEGIDRLVPTGTPFYVVNVGSNESVQNVAVVGDAPRRNRTIAGLPFTLQARVVNYSKTEKADVTLSAFLEEKEIARTPLNLKPGETITRKIQYTPKEIGLQKGRFEISSRSPDRFPDDDRYLFALQVVPRVKAVLVSGQQSADPFLSEGHYIHTALTAKAEDSPAGKNALPDPVKDFRSILDVREIPENLLTTETLKDASLVVLANCGNLNTQQFAWLRDYVVAGGGLLILPGDRVNPQVYNQQFFPVPGPQGETLTAATLGPAEGNPEQANTFEELSAFDFNHPALSIFQDPTGGNANYFRTVRVARRFKINLPARRGNAWPLIQFARSGPALVESRLGDGIVLLSAFPFNYRAANSWSNLPTKGNFVTLLLTLGAYLQHRPDAEVPAVVTADGVAEISVNGSWAPADVTVKLPSGATLPQTLERVGSRLLGAFDKTSDKGFYTVDVKTVSSLQSKAANLAFAVNLDPQESEFAMLDEPRFKELLPAAELTFIDGTAESQQKQGAIGNEQELYGMLIWLVFVVIAVEFLLATTSGRKREMEDAPISERIMSMSPGSWVGRMTGGGAKHEA